MDGSEKERKDAMNREKWSHITEDLCTTRCEVDK